jgi:hypothetical protein
MFKQEDILKDVLKNSIKSSHEINALEAIESVILFTEFITDSETCLIWFDGIDSIWTQSQFSNEKLLIAKEDNLKICEYLEKNNFLIWSKDKHKSEIKKINSILIENLEITDIESVIFTKITNNKQEKVGYISIFNKKGNFSKEFTEYDFQPLEIASLFASQTLNTRNLSLLTNYYIHEQEKAHEKQKTVVFNDFENSEKFATHIFYKSSDILSGDIYSLYRTKNNETFIFVADAMGHGIAPSLTSFSVATTVKQNIINSNNLSELLEKVMDNLQHILSDEEQLSCSFFWFNKNFSQVEYVIAGMYAPLILDGDEIISIRSNNIPFMNFSYDFTIGIKNINKFKSLLIYTDGIVEDTQDLEIDINKLLLDNNYLKKSFSELEHIELEDDTTVLKFEKLQ